jgi:hypothetical protein
LARTFIFDDGAAVREKKITDNASIQTNTLGVANLLTRLDMVKVSFPVLVVRLAGVCRDSPARKRMSELGEYVAAVWKSTISSRGQTTPARSRLSAFEMREAAGESYF